ncbi:hypothetical protein [Streptomyces noursei]|uniref:hypothetical protein n=1 Tax=Streptomyces noursei TaxID=1971 RepID=UPI0038171C33
MRTALTTAALCSAALLGPVGTAVADDDYTGGVQNTATMNFQDVNNDGAGYRWAFGDEDSEKGKHGKEGAGGKEGGMGGKEGGKEGGMGGKEGGKGGGKESGMGGKEGMSGKEGKVVNGPEEDN